MMEVVFIPEEGLSPDKVKLMNEFAKYMTKELKLTKRKPSKKQQNEKLLKYFTDNHIAEPIDQLGDYGSLHIEATKMFSHDDQIDAKSLFLLTYKRVPIWTSLYSVNCLESANYLIDNYADKITYHHHIKTFEYSKTPLNKKLTISDAFFYLDKDIIVHFNMYTNDGIILYSASDVEFVDKLFKDLSQFKAKREYDKPEISLLTQGARGLETTELEISKPKFSIKDNYNDDFVEVHNTIVKRMKKKNDKGIILLHGKPGTGKTYYVRYLITMLKKNIIFLPPNLAASITDPTLIKVLIENPDSVFVIEDAEEIIRSRDHTNNAAAVSTLLNLTDGLLSDTLNIRILASFNTDVSKIDPALMRKGRLIARYEFKELSLDKTQALSDKLGFKKQWEKGQPLTMIYNQDDPDFKVEERKKIGFGN